MENKTKNKIKTIIKIIVSISLITYVIYSAGPYKILAEIKGINILYFIVVIFITIIKIGVSAKKWQILLKAKGEIKNFLHVWRIYYIGNFFNLFLPTNVGGDIVKAHKMSKVSENSIEAYSSVFMERFTGVIAIFALAIVATTLFFNELPYEILIIIYLIFLPLIILSFIMIWRDSFVQKFRGLINILFKSFNPFSIKEKLIKLYKSVNLYTKKKKTLGYALLISLVFHTMLILTNYILALSIGMNIPLHYFFIFIPISAILLFLPISIRGFGVREVLYVYFFTQVGATTAQSVSLSFLVQLLGIISSLIGGFVYLFSQTKKI
ncbi:MAG: lysylphosphatidylglycerol synthase transmembrane domain-containing protein [Candidatus Thermoplasmatota archaeon]